MLSRWNIMWEGNVSRRAISVEGNTQPVEHHVGGKCLQAGNIGGAQCTAGGTPRGREMSPGGQYRCSAMLSRGREMSPGGQYRCSAMLSWWNATWEGNVSRRAISVECNAQPVEHHVGGKCLQAGNISGAQCSAGGTPRGREMSPGGQYRCISSHDCSRTLASSQTPPWLLQQMTDRAYLLWWFFAVSNLLQVCTGNWHLFCYTHSIDDKW